MKDTNQLPEPELGYIKTDKSNQPAFSARQMREAMKHALQAQVQGEPVGEIKWAANVPNSIREAVFYDLMPLIGTKLYTTPQPAQATQASWTDDQMISFAAMILMQGPHSDSIEMRLQSFRRLETLRGNITPAKATQAEVTDAEIESLFGKCGGHWSGDQWVIEDADLHPFARAILALRPERVPMTEDQVWHNDALMSANGTAGFKMDALMRIVRAAEAHHGIKPKEQA